MTLREPGGQFPGVLANAAKVRVFVINMKLVPYLRKLTIEPKISVLLKEDI